MYKSFYGLKENPFSLLPDPAYLYLSKQHEMAFTLLEYSLENQAGFCVITGKAGTGKTTLLRRLLNQIGDDVSVGLISNTHHSFGELLRWILHAYNLEDADKTRAQLHQVFVDYLIGQYAKNRRTMLIIDEAQNMSPEALEELRMLSNINSEKDLLVQVILVGQPPLREIFQRPELEQFAQRIAVDYHLDSLSREETHGYVHHRVIVAGGERELFSGDACDAVYTHSGGIPRLINLLCDLSLVYAYAGQAAVVTGELVEQVVSEHEKHGALPVFAKAARTGQHPGTETALPFSAPKTHTSAAARANRKTSGSRSAAEIPVAHAQERHGKMSRPVSAVPDKGRGSAAKSTPGRDARNTDVPHAQRMETATAGRHAPEDVPSSLAAWTAQHSPAKSGEKLVATPLGFTKSETKPGDAVTEQSGRHSPALKKSPGKMIDKFPNVSEQVASNNQAKAGRLPQKSSSQKDIAKLSENHPSKNPHAPAGFAGLRHRGDAASVSRRYIPVAVGIALLLSAPVTWRYFNISPERTPVISGGLSPTHSATVTPVADTTSTNVTQTNHPGSPAVPAENSSLARKAVAESSITEKDLQEESRLKLIERERDAALAKARVAERARKAIRAATMARERALAAEHEVALAQERERGRQIALAAEKTKEQERAAAAAEKARLEARAAAEAATMARNKMQEIKAPVQAVGSGASASSKPALPESASQESGAETDSGEPILFSANPCRGPSARFLSTCQ